MFRVDLLRSGENQKSGKQGLVKEVLGKEVTGIKVTLVNDNVDHCSKYNARKG